MLLKRLYKPLRRYIPEVEIARRIRDHSGKTERQARFKETFGAKDAVEIFAERKKSDRIYILGSGPSINELGDDKWELIRECDSFGFNNWMVHPFVPDYYMVEMISDCDFNKAFMKMLNSRAAEYHNVPILIKDAHRYYQGWGEVVPINDFPYPLQRNFLVSPQFTPSAVNARDLAAQLRAWNRLATLDSRFRRYLLSYRASIFLAIYISYLAGWKEIVLAGIDMRSSDYFWELSDKYPDYGLPSNRAMSNMHRTEDPQLGLPVSEAILALHNTILRSKGVRIEVSSLTSKLSEIFPLHDFGKRLGVVTGADQ